MTLSERNALVAKALPRAAHALAFHAVILTIILIPLAFVEIPNFFDYLNHVARWSIMLDIDGNGPSSGNYVRWWTPSPYLLVDAIGVWIAGFVGVYAAGKLLLIAIVSLTYVSVVTLHFAIWHRFSLWPAVSAFFVYHTPLAAGFLNFSLGVAVCLLSVAAWISLVRARWLVRFGLLLLLTAICYLTHIVATAAFMVIVSAWTLLWQTRRGRFSVRQVVSEIALVAIPFLLATGVFLQWTASSSYVYQRGVAFDLADYGLKSVVQALTAPVSILQPAADIRWFGALAVAGVAALVLGRLTLRIAPGWWLPLSCLAVIAALMPMEMFGTSALHFRFPPILALAFVAASSPKGDISASRCKLGAAVILVLAAVRAATLWPSLQAGDAQLRELREAVGVLEPGSAVLTVAGPSSPFAALQRGTRWQAPALAVIERDAFVPQIFTGPTQIRPSPRREALDALAPVPLDPEDLAEGLDPAFIAARKGEVLSPYDRVYWADWPAQFDYLIAFSGEPTDPQVQAHLRQIAKGSYFSIYEIR